MHKLKLFISIVVCTIAAAVCFGILHDQVTYSISPEYYTKFKFIQFGLADDNMKIQMSERAAALIVGIMATWWMGLLIGLFYAGILLFFKIKHGIWKIYFRTIALTFGIAILSGVTGYLYGKYHLLETEVDWYLPESLADRNSFICVGSIHNFSYIGGVIGCMAGIFYLLIQKSRISKQ